MMGCPVVVQVFFERHPDLPDTPRLRTPEVPDRVFMGLPLWVHEGKRVFAWAVDYAVCSDERWVVFGPYVDAATARELVAPLVAKEFCRGYRIINQHCFFYLPGYSRPVREAMWTDG